MRSAVRKLGNSSGVIIPKSLLRDLGVAAGDPVEVTVEAGRLVLIPVQRRARTVGQSLLSHRLLVAEHGDRSVRP